MSCCCCNCSGKRYQDQSQKVCSVSPKMNDADVSKQIQQMVRFIRQEAEEKANEISVSAEEVYIYLIVFSPLSLSIHALKPNCTFPSAGIQYREVAVGWSRKEEDQARVRTQRAPSRNSEEDVTSDIPLYSVSANSKFIRICPPLKFIEIKFWRLTPTRIDFDPYDTTVSIDCVIIVSNAALNLYGTRFSAVIFSCNPSFYVFIIERLWFCVF